MHIRIPLMQPGAVSPRTASLTGCTHRTHTHTHALPRLLAAAGRGTATLPLALSRCGPSGRPALAARRPQPQPTCRRGLRGPVPAAGARPRGWRRRRRAGAVRCRRCGAVPCCPPPPRTARLSAQGGRAEPSPRHPDCRAGRKLTCGRRGMRGWSRSVPTGRLPPPRGKGNAPPFWGGGAGAANGAASRQGGEREMAPWGLAAAPRSEVAQRGVLISVLLQEIKRQEVLGIS